MSQNSGPKPGWLEIVHEDDKGHLGAFCPYRDKTVDANICFACKDCSGLAISPETRTSYVVCDRAAADRIWVEGGGETPPQVHKCCGCGGEIEDEETAVQNPD